MRSMVKRTSIFITLLTLSISAQSAFDAVRIVQDEIGFGARSLAIGGAYTALADDYSAIYWNPAGLACIRDNQVFGEISHFNMNNSASFAGTTTDGSENYTRLRSLGVALPFPTRRGSFVMALGYNRVRDFDQKLEFSGFNSVSNDLAFNIDDNIYAFDQNVEQSEIVSDEGGLNQWSVGAGFALSPNFNAGITATIWEGRDEYDLRFSQVDVNNNYNVFPADFYSYELTQQLVTNYSGFNLKFGGLFELSRNVQLGATVGLPTTFKLEEVHAFNDLLVFDDGFEDVYEEPANEFSYKVKTPYHLDAGIALTSRNLKLAGSIRYRDWSKVEFTVRDEDLGTSEYNDLLDENLVIADAYQATTEFHVGGELKLNHSDLILRGGYALIPSPVKDESATADLDRTIYSAGVGFQVDRYVTLDIAFQRSSWEQRSEDSLTPGGTFEEITANRIFGGLTYRF